MFDCIHHNKLFCIYEKLEELVIKLNQGNIYNLMDEHNELKILIEKLYLSAAKNFDSEDIVKKKMEMWRK